MSKIVSKLIIGKIRPNRIYINFLIYSILSVIKVLGYKISFPPYIYIFIWDINKRYLDFFFKSIDESDLIVVWTLRHIKILNPTQVINLWYVSNS